SGRRKKRSARKSPSPLPVRHPRHPPERLAEARPLPRVDRRGTRKDGTKFFGRRTQVAKGGVCKTSMHRFVSGRRLSSAYQGASASIWAGRMKWFTDRT